MAGSIRRLAHAQARLESTVAAAQAEAPAALSRADLFPFVWDDPVPRLLWLAGRRDPSAPRRLLETAGGEAFKQPAWSALADALATGLVATAPNLARNGSFVAEAPGGQEPRFLFPHSGALPAGWEVRAVATETGRMALVDDAAMAPRRAIRMEGGWDAMLYQWLPSRPGQTYVVTARVRGNSSEGDDEALYLRFLNSVGQGTGLPRAQSLAKGLTAGWRTLVLADAAPADAAWVGIGVGATRQVAGDWLEAGALDVRAVAPGDSP